MEGRCSADVDIWLRGRDSDTSERLHARKDGEKRIKDVRLKFDDGDRWLRAVTLEEMTLRRSSWDI
jgi:hypothetical protein